MPAPRCAWASCSSRCCSGSIGGLTRGGAISVPAAWHALGDAMFGASSSTEWHLNYDTTAQWYAPVNACQAAVIFTAGQLPYAKVTVCGGCVSVEATADVGNQPDAASLQAGLNEAWTIQVPHCRGTCAMPSPLLSQQPCCTLRLLLCARGRQSYAFEPAPAVHNIARSATRAGAAHGPGRPSTTTGVGPAACLGLGLCFTGVCRGCRHQTLRSRGAPSEPLSAPGGRCVLRLPPARPP